MTSLDFAFDYARDASTALNWRSITDRALISENLRTNADVIGGEMVHAKSVEERKYFFKQVERVYTRLAVIDLLTAREAESKFEYVGREQAWCRSVLNGMAELITTAVLDSEVRMDRLAQAQSAALNLERLRDVFEHGRDGRLLVLSKTVAEMDLTRAGEMYHALYEVTKMAKGFEGHQSAEDEKGADDIFARGHKLLRRELGLDKESGRR